MHYLCDEMPDLVVAGVNIGKNTGLGFVLSSATVGAAMHANLCEPALPGLALSQAFVDHRIASAMKRGELPQEQVDMVIEGVRNSIKRIWKFTTESSDFLSEPLTWNVNFPYSPEGTSSIVESHVGNSRLHRCFDERGGVYPHNLKHYVQDESDFSDGMVVERGDISFSRIDFRLLCGS